VEDICAILIQEIGNCQDDPFPVRTINQQDCCILHDAHPIKNKAGGNQWLDVRTLPAADRKLTIS
jgi:hypothetical protein